jgi:hypothetical protein
VLRLSWILAFGLTLFYSRAQALPCHDGSCQKQEDRGDSSIQLKASQRGDDLHGVPYPLVDTLPSGVRKKDELPPSLHDDWRASERNRTATLPALGGGLSSVRADVRHLRIH